MGWSIDLVSNKEITENEVQEIICKLPEKLSFALGNSKQPWGWSTGVDVANPEGKKLWLSGAYGYSENIAEEFALFIKNGLNEKGHEIELKYRW
ncbi:hypothetical protein Elgi_37490 [Paenibacillus elgii]|uniref:hypothetical protein n=1 Tax=Paenibacillus elgii TaxID=189691 RepID=UPI002D7AE0DE|nr:hypothetical protein Elgi_37490 [Paenibacillus elgii]